MEGQPINSKYVKFSLLTYATILREATIVFESAEGE
jgi:hypothetical protein